MSPLLSAGKRLFALGSAVVLPSLGFAQSFSPQGSEYSIAGSLSGDQTFPHVSINASGGYLVWQDNVTDRDGLGISARRISGNLSGSFGVFRVNQQDTGDQENARVALLKDGGAAFVWQGGVSGFQHVYARFLKGDGTFASEDRLVNTFTNNHQINPAVSALSDGGAVVVWSSYGQDGSMYGVYGQRFSAVGEKAGSEFQINQTTDLSQRTPSVIGLADGGFVVAWISEKPLGMDANGAPRYAVSAYARLFDASGGPRADEFRINSGTDACANPNLCASANGGFAAVWGQRDGIVFTNSWDVFARCFNSSGVPVSADLRVNAFAGGNQYAPRIDSIGSDYLVVWTSVGQDGSREGVIGRFLSENGVAVGDEFGVNTTTVSQQLHPALASDGADRFVVVWSSFIGGDASFDLFAQRYAVSQLLPTPSVPFVSPLSQSKLSLTWPELSGFDVDHYEIYVDSNSTPIGVTNNMWTVSGLVAGSTHTFALVYQLADGRRSTLSAPATGTTWAEDENLDGLPDDWEARYWGSSPAIWPAANVDSDGDGATNLQEFLAGTDPTDANSVLRVQLIASTQGTRLSWNSQPGLMYQVQVSRNSVAGSWINLGTPRFAAGTSDSVLEGLANESAYYRVIRLR
jgi:hypothetical protein